jgi:hypothetical protein
LTLSQATSHPTRKINGTGKKEARTTGVPTTIGKVEKGLTVAAGPVIEKRNTATSDQGLETDTLLETSDS